MSYTYGTLTKNATIRLAAWLLSYQDLNATTLSSFLDLGSGIGTVLFRMAVLIPFNTIFGIEKSGARCEVYQSRWKILNKSFPNLVGKIAVRMFFQRMLTRN